MKPYKPSNGTEGIIFQEQFCDRCLHNQDIDDECGVGCPILIATFFASIGAPSYPNQWVEDDNGSNPRCLAHNPAPAKKIVETALPLTQEQREWLAKQTGAQP